MEIATHDIGQWAAIVVSVIGVLTYFRSQSHKREEQAARLARMETELKETRANVAANKKEFDSHEELQTEGYGVLVDIRREISETRKEVTEVKGDVRVNGAKLEGLESRLDRDFLRTRKGAGDE